MKPTLVVGAGAQGLTFALALARRGKPVILVEKARAIGGQARSFHYKGFTFDLGLHAFVSREPALLRLARELLGPDFSRFYPRAASRLGGALVEDSSYWHVLHERRRLYSIVKGRDESWNCMRIAPPPPVVYPRRGGFGALFEKMAAAFRAKGGRIVLGAAVGTSDLIRENGRLAAARIGGRRVEVSGCYWSAGTYLLEPKAARRAAALQPLVLFNVLAEGRAPVPYHWVRLADETHPFLPRLVYYPGRFSPANAPRGRYGVGAAVPLPPPDKVPREARALYDWFSADPGSFSPLVVDRLDGAGLLRRGDVLEVRVERAALPPERTERAASRHPFENAANFWDADRWLADDARESGVPLQMASALAAAEELFS